MVNAHVMVEGCTVTNGAKIKFTNVWWAIQVSPVVLRGSYVDSNQWKNTVTLSVSCIYKNGGLDLPLNITLLNAKYRSSSLCHGTHLDDGKVYIIGLRPAAAGIADTFHINEPGPVYNSVAVDGNSLGNQRRIADLCAFGNITYPQGYLDCQGQQSGCDAYTCPTRNDIHTTTCFQPTKYNGGQSLYSISILLLLLSPLVPMLQWPFLWNRSLTHVCPQLTPMSSHGTHGK